MPIVGVNVFVYKGENGSVQGEIKVKSSIGLFPTYIWISCYGSSESIELQDILIRDVYGERQLSLKGYSPYRSILDRILEKIEVSWSTKFYPHLSPVRTPQSKAKLLKHYTERVKVYQGAPFIFNDNLSVNLKNTRINTNSPSAGLETKGRTIGAYRVDID